MKNSLENTGGLGRKLTIKVPAEKVSSTFDRVYKGIKKNANIKGFRKGKAPLQTIKSLYSDRVKQDVLEDLISEAYSHALGEHSLRPVSPPQINFDKLEEIEDFHFTAEFEIRPEIVLKKIENLKVEKEKLDVTEEKIDSIILQIRESRANLVPIIEIRPAQAGDIVDIDFIGTIDGKPLEGGSMRDYKLHWGSNSFIPGFESGIEGMSVGAKKELQLKFPDDYGQKEIAGKQVVFDVTLKSILKKDLAELNDEFVKTLDGCNTAEELRELIRKDVTQQETKRINEDLRARILHELVKENPIEVPKAMQNQQKEFLIQDTEKRMKQQGMNASDYELYKNKWDKDFSETAAFMIQSSFLVEALAEKNKLAATKEEFNERLENYAKQSHIDIAKLREFYNANHERQHQMKYQITEEKVVEYLIKHADIKELPADKLTKA
ncbi:MAG: trigger factor [Bdellovibrionales bacterium RBG_16_40_8]|nr:MAG: trigger factor [Bdellovibrionales bacterium RBG_16_40_8]